MIDSDVLAREIDSLSVIDSIAVMSTATSTNLVACRVIDECIENDIPIPSALIVAREQRSGKGREARTWVSPRDSGIWSTILTTCPSARLPLLPLEISLTVATFLERLSLKPQIKWPNDILVNERKIAGILIEARSTPSGTHVAIGVGINLFGPAPHEGGITAEEAGANAGEIDQAILAWCRTVDEMLASPQNPAAIISEWRRRSFFSAGDRVASLVSGRRIEGSWKGIDESGHACIATTDGETRVAAGEIIVLARG